MSLVINACPGAGKTTRVIASIKGALSRGMEPERIVAITFTVEAANLLKKRVGDEKVKASTIHSLAWNIARPSQTDGFFDDMLREATAVLREDPSHINIGLLVIDEAQDITPLQLEFLRELSKVALRTIVVGDPDQAIYGFIGSDPALMYNICNEYDTEEMSISYRVPSTISSVLNRMFILKTPIISQDSGGSIDIQIVEHIDGKLIDTLLNTDNETTVLCRANASVYRISHALSLAGENPNMIVPMSYHPYVALAASVIGAKHTLDVRMLRRIAYLISQSEYYVHRAMSAISLARDSGTRVTIDFLQKLFVDNIYGMDETVVIVNSRSRKVMHNIIRTIELFDSYYDDLSLTSIEALLEEIREMFTLPTEMWNTVSMNDMVQAVYSRLTTGQDTYLRLETGSHLSVMTIHAAKGKQFPHVILPIDRSYDIYTEEEFRVAYVGCTRASESLSIIVQDMKRNRFKSNLVDVLAREIGII